MASSAPLCALLWDIQRQLHLLSEEQLYRLTSSLKDEGDKAIPEVTGTNEPERFEFIVDYLKSDQLKKLEDEGMSCLLTIRDKIDELKSSTGSQLDMDTAINDKEVNGGSSVAEQASGQTAVPLTSVKVPDKPESKRRCEDCIQLGNQDCCHCFRCGQAGHRAVGCLKKETKVGNGRRSLVRDNQ
ncbi:interferon-induced very large GTPase 1 isoform X1 [Labeo rohita]|uniref:Interferon-induced very large GTPase 1 isoform X1 n=1 Tax=Labeo rohita TaxID=84645 RepID=A0A498MYY5_LABRO|nr:interferon-induced very large GTPase 1 isoform X1 [Labeo rohita]